MWLSFQKYRLKILWCASCHGFLEENAVTEVVWFLDLFSWMSNLTPLMFRSHLLREYCSSSWFMYWLSSHYGRQEARASLPLAFWLPVCSPQFHMEKSLACKLEACASYRAQLIGRPFVPSGGGDLVFLCSSGLLWALFPPQPSCWGCRSVHTPCPTNGWDWGKRIA